MADSMPVDDDDDEKSYPYGVGGTSATSRQKGKSGAGKSAFKPPKAGKVPSGRSGGGKAHIKLSGGKSKGKAPPKIKQAASVASQAKARLASTGKDADEARRSLPKAIKPASKKRRAG